MDKEQIGRFIAKLRKEKKWTQDDLAEKLFVDRTTISKWERGLYIPDVSVLKKMQDLFDVSLDELVSAAKHEEAPIKLEKKKNKVFKLKYLILLLITLLVIFIILKLINVFYVNDVKKNIDNEYIPDYIKNNFKYNYDENKFYNIKNCKGEKLTEEFLVNFSLYINILEKDKLSRHFEYDFTDNSIIYYEIVNDDTMESNFLYNLSNGECIYGKCNINIINEYLDKYEYILEKKRAE